MDAPVFILILPILALCIVGLLGWAGCFRRDALLAGPSRDAGLVPVDLLVGLGLMVVGASVGGLLLNSGLLGPVEIDPTHLPGLDPANLDPTDLPAVDQQADITPTKLSTMDQAKRVLLAQAMGQLPIVLYLVWRVSAVPRGIWRVGVLPSRPGRDLAWGLLGLLVCAPLVMGTIQTTAIIGQWFGHETPAIGHELLILMRDSDSMVATGLLVCAAVILAPVLEEGIFRGLFQSVMVETLKPSMRWQIVLVSAMVFASIHISLAAWQTLPGLLVLGLILGWLYEKSGSLWPGIVVHVGFNTLNIAIMVSMTAPPEVTS